MIETRIHRTKIIPDFYMPYEQTMNNVNKNLSINSESLKFDNIYSNNCLLDNELMYDSERILL